MVNILLSRSSWNNKRSSQLLLSDLAAQEIDFDNDITITTNRSCIWNKAHCWYKAAQVNPSRLKMNLMPEFAGEAGLDAGAPCNEFFTSVLQHINAEFFEGRKERRIPKHEWEMESLRWLE